MSNTCATGYAAVIHPCAASNPSQARTGTQAAVANTFWLHWRCGVPLGLPRCWVSRKGWRKCWADSLLCLLICLCCLWCDIPKNLQPHHTHFVLLPTACHPARHRHECSNEYVRIQPSCGGWHFLEWKPHAQLAAARTKNMPIDGGVPSCSNGPRPPYSSSSTL